MIGIFRIPICIDIYLNLSDTMLSYEIDFSFIIFLGVQFNEVLGCKGWLMGCIRCLIVYQGGALGELLV